MKKNSFYIFILIFISFCFVVLFKSLENSNTYIPDDLNNKSLPFFKSKKLTNKEEINSDELFSQEEDIYLLNIWSSWCAPCRKEHPILMKIKDNTKFKIIGLNYKDDSSNAKKFIEEYGNPYAEIITDDDGTIAISLGAYGVPETFIISKDKKIIKRFIGIIDEYKIIKEINLLLK